MRKSDYEEKVTYKSVFFIWKYLINFCDLFLELEKKANLIEIFEVLN